MNTFFFYWDMLLGALKPYWAELVGSFLMATMGNMATIRGTQKESFRLFSSAFYTLFIKDLTAVAFTLIAALKLNVVISDQAVDLTHLGFTCLIAALFIAGAFKNMKLYFSSVALTIILSILFAGVSIGLSLSEKWYSVGNYLTSLYLTLGLLVAGISFYINPTTRRNTAIRSVGNGFIVLTICYGYQLFDLVGNIQQLILLAYLISIVLTLASQAQLLNIEVTQLSYRLEAEKKSKRDVWEISPFPIMISKLRDDTVLYMNPVAQQMFLLDRLEFLEYRLADYFVNKEQKESLLILLRQTPVVKSFEALVHHPKKNNDFWIDLTTRITDLDEEIVLYTTFKDITEQKRTAQLLKEQASTDPLTGLYNRRQFEILAYQAIQSSRRYNHPYTVGMLDIDFFKKINDTYGHDAGDTVLKNLAKTLKETLRKADVVARYGGEEFVMFLSNTSPADARTAAEHVREAIADMETTVNGKVIPITVSIGLSDDQITNLAGLVRQADEALYASKANGRNQTTLYQDLHRGSYPKMPKETSDNK